MTGRAGTTTAGEYWARCPFCGDSQHDSSKAHFSINLKTGVYHCYRCKAGGVLPPKKRLQFSLFAESTEIERELIDYSQLIPGAGTTRKSLLPRFHYRDDQNNWDAFQMKNPRTNEITGVHLRLSTPKKSCSFGNLGVAWSSDKSKLISSSEHPLRLVEGPYDVLYQQDVCCFGLPSRKNLESLRGHFVILCPDGDVWSNPDLKERILHLLHIRSSCDILGIEFLSYDKDPDEVPEEDRCFIPRNQLTKLFERKRIWPSLHTNDPSW